MVIFKFSISNIISVLYFSLFPVCILPDFINCFLQYFSVFNKKVPNVPVMGHLIGEDYFHFPTFSEESICHYMSPSEDIRRYFTTNVFLDKFINFRNLFDKNLAYLIV